MKTTYIGILNDEVNEIKTLVTAGDPDEAMALVIEKFRVEFGLEFRDEDVMVSTFME